jgi:hypothetical protein
VKYLKYMLAGPELMSLPSRPADITVAAAIHLRLPEEQAVAPLISGGDHLLRTASLLEAVAVVVRLQRLRTGSEETEAALQEVREASGIPGLTVVVREVPRRPEVLPG